LRAPISTCCRCLKVVVFSEQGDTSTRIELFSFIV